MVFLLPLPSSSLQALAHKTLVLLLGVDPSKQLDHPLPTAHPHVTYAYMKYMWKSARKVGANKLTSDGLLFTFWKYLVAAFIQVIILDKLIGRA